MMKKLSSKWTFFNKKIYPAIWFGFLGVFELIALFVVVTKPKGPPAFVLVVPVVMAIFGYVLMKFLVFDLIDEVYDQGDGLLLRNKGNEIRIHLKEIKNVNYSVMTNPPRVTLSLRYLSEWGDKLTFSPPIVWIPFKRNRDIDDLIDRIDQARMANDSPVTMDQA